MNMEKHPEFTKQILQKNSNARFTFGLNCPDENSSQHSDFKHNFGNIFAEANQRQANMISNMKGPFGQEFSDQIMVHLLELESKWTQKETQIKDYVENLKKTIEEKDVKIEKLLIENYKLFTQLTRIGKQKNQIFQKLNQIHGTMVQLQNEKLQNDYDRKSSEKCHRSQQNEKIAYILKLAKQKDSKVMHPQLPLQSKISEMNSERQSQTESKSMQKRILSNLIKLFEENFNLNSAFGSDESSQNNCQYLFAKKERQIRATMVTNHTYDSNPRQSFINKDVISPIDSEKLKPSSQAKKQPKCYKSARTITFSKDQEAESQNQADKQRFYSHNVIQFNQKIYSERDTSPQKESGRSISRKQQKLLEQTQANLKGYSQNQLRIQSRALNQSHESSQFSKEKKKRKDRKKTTNLDYSLSSSLVSESQTNEMEYQLHDQSEKQSFKPLTHEIMEEKKTQIALSKLSASSFNMESKISESDSSLKPILQKKPVEHSRATNKPSQQKSQNLFPFDEPKTNSKLKQLEASDKKSIEKSQLSSPESSSPFKKVSLLINNTFTFQNTPQNHSFVLQNTSDKLCENTSKKSLTIERQNSITFDHTNQKKCQFQPNQLDSFETQVKNHQNQNQHQETNLPISNEKIHLLVPKIGPETKCSSFEEKSYGNSFYFNKSSSSDDPFKKLKIQSENSENQQRNKLSKLNFENQMLKSYNKVLEKQTKKMTQTQKLMEKFNSQNVSILNKIHKKSIS